MGAGDRIKFKLRAGRNIERNVARTSLNIHLIVSGIEKIKNKNKRQKEGILKYADLTNAPEYLLLQPQKSTFKEGIISLTVNDIHIYFFRRESSLKFPFLVSVSFSKFIILYTCYTQEQAVFFKLCYVKIAKVKCRQALIFFKFIFVNKSFKIYNNFQF